MRTGAGPEPALRDGREIGPVLWVICGAGRGVGKTRLALDLCRVLPDAAYAKQGTSLRRDDKPASYFHRDDELEAFLAAETRAGRRHLVVESNALARRDSGDIIVFLDAPVGGNFRGEPRADAGELRDRAHVRMGRDPAETATMDGLREHLARLGLDPAAMSAVIEVLQDQDAWNRGRGQS